MNKGAIQKYAIWARQELIKQVDLRAYQWGITEKGYGDANAAVVAGRVLSPQEKKQRTAFIDEIARRGYALAVEDVAYTWFNRFIALRFMEVNDYLPAHIRVFSDASGGFNPEILRSALYLDLPGLRRERVQELLNANKTEELYRAILLAQCNALGEALPEMFEPMGAYTEMLLPGNILRPDSVLGRLVADIPEGDWRDAVQLIGWMYQYYNTEPKQRVFDGLKRNIKISKENIPAATQLFTPDWIVRYMVENSLGRLYIMSRWAAAGGERGEQARMAFEKALAGQFGWKYYIPEAEQTPEVRQKLTADRCPPGAPFNVEDVRILDPCMGSGHILVYAFDVLMQIYRACGYADRDAARLILDKNLHGLDIDRRAYQLAYFALIMKARQYDRRIFASGAQPRVYHPAGWAEGEEYGSLAVVDELPPAPARTLPDGKTYDPLYPAKARAWHFKRLLTQAYDVVVTNPPYMGAGGMGEKLAKFVKERYPDSKSDLFAVFIERGNNWVKENGYNCMVTMQSWMFLSSFEKMRKKLLQNKTITNLMHMENMVLGIAFGTAVTVFKNAKIPGYKGTYNQIKLQDIVDDVPPVFPVMQNRFAQVSTDNFEKIPGSPVAYWVSLKLLAAFDLGTSIDTISVYTGSQNITADNEKFLRYLWEVRNIRIGVDKRWAFYIKGGLFRKWYGNIDLIIDWSPDARMFYKTNKTSNLLNPALWFREGITYTELTSGVNSFRYLPPIAIFDKKGPCILDVENSSYCLGYLNSIVAVQYFKLLNPTITLQIKDVKNTPILFEESSISIVSELVDSCIDISRADWDSFETSWDFDGHPLLSVASRRGQGNAGSVTVAECLRAWADTCRDRFNRLKANEEELNRIFIDIYGLQDELTPEVAEKDVTVYRVIDEPTEEQRGMRYVLSRRDVMISLISYAVGCMFGRYSLDAPGLAYAGGEWNADKYRTFPADKDNVIPICDDEYFTDDIVGRFVDFIRVVWGAAALEENLRFIASALQGKGTPREVIRAYFLNDFYADHCRTYQKRPIYWLFDAGKKNSFKALIYLHRYSRDLMAKLRTDYVHEQQERYRTQLATVASSLENAAGAERVRLLKQQEKLAAQASEISAYEALIHPLADSMLPLDLDDGVKVNYALFGDAVARIK